MVIYLNEYRQSKASRAVAQDRHEEERMWGNGAPVPGIAASFDYRHAHELSPQLPDDLDFVDLDTFVKRVYALASQI